VKCGVGCHCVVSTFSQSSDFESVHRSTSIGERDSPIVRFLSHGFLSEVRPLNFKKSVKSLRQTHSNFGRTYSR